MNYPFWYIPHLGSGWVIGIIAIFHVMISQFAVGGGLYLPVAERKAMRMADREIANAWLNMICGRCWFMDRSSAWLEGRTNSANDTVALLAAIADA